MTRAALAILVLVSAADARPTPDVHLRTARCSVLRVWTSGDRVVLLRSCERLPRPVCWATLSDSSAWPEYCR